MYACKYTDLRAIKIYEKQPMALKKRVVGSMAKVEKEENEGRHRHL